MNMIELSEKQRLAIEAVVYGCNTNKRLVGATFMKDIHSDKKESISFYEAIETVYEMLEQPSVYAVEVVRCKDCIHRDGTTGQPNIVCYNMKDDDFCSYGERRADHE